MSEYYHILDTHLALLWDKGCREKDLCNPNIEGLLFREFQTKLSTAVNEALRFGYPTDFTVDAMGWYETKLENPVNIKLSYRIDLENGNLSIDQLTLEFNGKVTSIPITSNKELPHSGQIPIMVKRENLQKTRVVSSPPTPISSRRKL
ncbi:hypothetical protein [Chitinophaga sp. Ak27]|uniref:hypothetical protein n=1 Tax=Chitinophaga sp. Ak27 TaxID=2726116 RepID=UPI00145E53B3|nr:hypothetical protein [Chitinophaga sp. Ak27]NLU91396.1 hypothetical protein [Chitinophaga sp. Ak27]